MIWVDTNILIRIVTNDVPELAASAIAMIKQGQRGELVILDSVLVEFFFVLETYPLYRFPRDKAAALFNGIVKLPQFQVSETARAAFVLYAQNKKLDFVDCLLAVSTTGRPENIMTFDKELLKAVGKTS